MVYIGGSTSATILAVYLLSIGLLCSTNATDNQTSSSSSSATANQTSSSSSSATANQTSSSSSSATNNQTSSGAQNCSSTTSSGTQNCSSTASQSGNRTSFTLAQNSCCEDFSNYTCDAECGGEDEYDDELAALFETYSDDVNDCYYYDKGCRTSNPQDLLLELIVQIGKNAKSCCFNGTNFVPQVCNGSIIYVEDKHNRNNRFAEMSISPCYNFFYEGDTRIYVRNPNKTSKCCPCKITCNGNNTCGNNNCNNDSSSNNASCTSTGTNSTSNCTNTDTNGTSNCTNTDTTTTTTSTPAMTTPPNTISTTPSTSTAPPSTTASTSSTTSPPPSTNYITPTPSYTATSTSMHYYPG